MAIRISVEGDVDFETGQAILDIADGKKGMLYRIMSGEIRNAISRNADASYDRSPAKLIALESCDDWQHEPGHHVLKIQSTDYANYRQYGCGGIPEVVLVDLTESDIETLAFRMIEEIGFAL